MTRARDVANYIPGGGTAGQALIKASNEDYDFTYGAPGLPDIDPGAP